MEPRRLHKAKRIDNGEWVEGYYFPYRESPTRYADGSIHFANTVSYTHIILRPDTQFLKGSEKVEIDFNTLCQCTGKYTKADDNVFDNIIYENDRLSNGTTTVVIKFYPDKGFIAHVEGWYDLDDTFPCDELLNIPIFKLPLGFKIIGNIHD